MKLYHFSCGNTTRGTIGFCANIRAESKTKAVERLADLLPDELEVRREGMHPDEYVLVCFNGSALDIRAIDDVTDADN